MASVPLPDDISPPSARPKDRLIDPWTFLDYKAAFGERTSGASWVSPTWVGSHHRRLQAYRVLEEFYRNSNRNWLPMNATEDDIASRREYGDSFVVVEQFLNSVMGDDATIVVPEAMAEKPPEGATAYQAALDEWSINDNFDLKSEECERTSIKLGDGVYVLGWDSENDRPTCEVWDPGFYFPVIDASAPGNSYPKKVHLAYEFEEASSMGVKEKYVRRHTYEMVRLVMTDDETGDPLVDEATGANVPGERNYKWNSKGSNWTVLYSVAVWKVNDIEVGAKPDDFTWGRAHKVEVQVTDLFQDYIPVVHIPCFNAGSEHFGFSVLSPVAQILDDIMVTDTDLQAASRTTGSPPLAIGGSSLPTDSDGRVNTYGPGQLFQTGDGSMTMLDTSKSLDALIKMDNHQLERLSVNARIPESMLGRVKPSEVPSGIALTISFGPHVGVINRMRKVRRHKYALLFKFIGRMLMNNGKVDEIFPAEYAFGSFVPSDKMAALELVMKGLTAEPPAFSQETGVRMLMEAGFPIDNAVAEIKAIRSQDFESANKLLDATGDQNLARTYLGLQPVPVTPPPVQIEEPAEEDLEPGAPPAPTI